MLANSADGVRDIGLSELESYLQQCGEDVGVIAEQLRLLQPGRQVLPPPISPAEDDCSVPPPAAGPADHPQASRRRKFQVLCVHHQKSPSASPPSLGKMQREAGVHYHRLRGL